MKPLVKYKQHIRRNTASSIRRKSVFPYAEEVPAEVYSAAFAATLTHLDECRYLHQIIASNLPYYSAKVKLSRLQGHLPKSRRSYKNHNFLIRLTAKGMVLLKTRYATKPKNPE